MFLFLRKLFIALPKLQVKWLYVVVFFGVAFFASCIKTDFQDNAITNPDLNPDPPSAPNPFKGDKMNIIFILTDDVGYEIPGFTGGQSYSTPNLDNMAAGGTQFVQCYGSPLCSPSRVMLMTGQYLFKSNYSHGWGILDENQHSFANILKDAGYATCVSGKWQFDGGDASIHRLGFDKYRVSEAFYKGGEDENGVGNLFKNPLIYENGAYWPDDSTKGKYGDDLFRDYVFDFIDSNAGKKPFFAYWAMNLIHLPFGPTPDDPEFASWDPDARRNEGDSVYYPSMVKYMDKLVGQLVQKLRDKNIEQNTIIVFTGDNGSTGNKHSLWRDQVIEGGKSKTTQAGTHLPMLVYCPGTVAAGRIDSSIVSFVDFMHTFGDIGQATIPATYGVNDGISFATQMKGMNNGYAREWAFCHFPGAGKFDTIPRHLKRWIQNTTYKQYDNSLDNNLDANFYDIITDPLELDFIGRKKMTTDQLNLSKTYQRLMNELQ